MEWRTLLVLVHVLAAFWYVAGYVGTNVCTEYARRTTDDNERRLALRLSGQFDRRLNAPGGTIVGLSGLVTLWAFGRSLGTPWVLASVILFAGVIALGIVYWRRFGIAIDAAAAADDWAAVRRLLTQPRVMVVSRLENLAVLAIVTLMVLQPE